MGRGETFYHNRNLWGPASLFEKSVKLFWPFGESESQHFPDDWHWQGRLVFSFSSHFSFSSPNTTEWSNFPHNFEYILCFLYFFPPEVYEYEIVAFSATKPFLCTPLEILYIQVEEWRIHKHFKQNGVVFNKLKMFMRNDMMTMGRVERGVLNTPNYWSRHLWTVCKMV